MGDTVCLTKPKIVPLWPFMGKVADLAVYSTVGMIAFSLESQNAVQAPPK